MNTESAAEPKANRKKLIMTIVILAGFACAVPALLHSSQDARQLPHPRLWWLVAAVAMFFGHYFIQAMGWHAILRGLGQSPPARLSIRMWYMSLIARWMPGRVWYSATRLFLAKEAGISLTAVTFAIVVELIYIMIGGVLTTLIFAGAMIKGMLASSGGVALGGLVLMIIVTGALILRPRTLVALSRFKFFRKAVQKLTGETLDESNAPQMTTAQSLGLLLYYTVFWIYSGVMFGVLANAFIPMNLARWTACIPAFAGSWLIGFFSIVTPAGLGAREGAMWLMLKSVMPQAYALILAITSRIMMVCVELASAGIFSFVLGRRARRPERIDSTVLRSIPVGSDSAS